MNKHFIFFKTELSFLAIIILLNSIELSTFFFVLKNNIPIIISTIKQITKLIKAFIIQLFREYLIFSSVETLKSFSALPSRLYLLLK